MMDVISAKYRAIRLNVRHVKWKAAYNVRMAGDSIRMDYVCLYVGIKLYKKASKIAMMVIRILLMDVTSARGFAIRIVLTAS